MIVIDKVFIKNNFPHLIFYIFFNTYTAYLFWTNTYPQNEYFITSSITVYEILNTFYELTYPVIKKEMVLHHAVTGLNGAIMLHYYNIYPDFIKDGMYCQTVMFSSTLYLNIRYIFPELLAPRLAFFISFFYYRFYLTYPFIYKLITGHYVIDSLVVKFILTNAFILFALTLYWGFLILKIAYKILFIQDSNKKIKN